MVINKGGRGKKADYETKTIRVPLPIINRVENLILDFHADNHSNDSNELLSLVEVTAIAQNILKSKKSAKESIKKLLQVLYKSNDTNL